MTSHTKKYRLERKLHSIIKLLFPGPVILGYHDARNAFIDVLLELAAKKIKMNIFLLSGEQSLQTSLLTYEAIKPCFECIDELMIGGGPGIAIARRFVKPGQHTSEPTFKIKPHATDLSGAVQKIPVYDMIKIPKIQDTPPYVQMCLEFEETQKNRSISCQYNLEPLGEEQEVVMERRHIAMIEVVEKDSQGKMISYLPIAVAEELHLPFKPRQAAVYKHLNQSDDDYTVFMEFKTNFLKNSLTHRLEEPVQFRVVDPAS